MSTKFEPTNFIHGTTDNGEPLHSIFDGTLVVGCLETGRYNQEQTEAMHLGIMLGGAAGGGMGPDSIAYPATVQTVVEDFTAKDHDGETTRKVLRALGANHATRIPDAEEAMRRVQSADEITADETDLIRIGFIIARLYHSLDEEARHSEGNATLEQITQAIRDDGQVSADAAFAFMATMETRDEAYRAAVRA